MSEYTERCEGIKFDASRNAMYHAWRRSYLDKINKALSLVVILAGASAVGDLGMTIKIDAKWFAFAAAAAGALQLVFDFGGAAREHYFLQQRYNELVADVMQKPAPTKENIAYWDSWLFGLYGGEGAPLRALDAMAYNAVCDSVGKGPRLQIHWYHWLFAQIYPFNQSTFSPEKE